MGVFEAEYRSYLPIPEEIADKTGLTSSGLLSSSYSVGRLRVYLGSLSLSRPFSKPPPSISPLPRRSNREDFYAVVRTNDAWIPPFIRPSLLQILPSPFIEGGEGRSKSVSSATPRYSCREQVFFKSPTRALRVRFRSCSLNDIERSLSRHRVNSDSSFFCPSRIANQFCRFWRPSPKGGEEIPLIFVIAGRRSRILSRESDRLFANPSRLRFVLFFGFLSQGTFVPCPCFGLDYHYRPPLATISSLLCCIYGADLMGWTFLGSD